MSQTPVSPAMGYRERALWVAPWQGRYTPENPFGAETLSSPSTFSEENSLLPWMFIYTPYIFEGLRVTKSVLRRLPPALNGAPTWYVRRGICYEDRSQGRPEQLVVPCCHHVQMEAWYLTPGEFKSERKGPAIPKWSWDMRLSTMGKNSVPTSHH